MTIKSLSDFVPLFPPDSVLKHLEKVWHSPCPFCTSDGSKEQYYNDVYFYGEDRLLWYPAGPWCRFCSMAGRGNGNGFHTWDEVARKLNVDIDDQLDTEIAQYLEEEPLRMLWDESMVERAHANVDRAFWYRFNWTDEVIDRFKLGTGVLYQSDGVVNTIPMEVKHVSDEEENLALAGLFYVSGRRAGLPPKRTPGSSRSFCWTIEALHPTDESRSTVIVAEGEKDAISASFLFPEYTVVATFGASTWTKAKTDWLRSMGFKTFVILGDNDLAGQNMSRNATLWATSLGMVAKKLVWDTNIFPNNFDTTDLLQNYGYDYARTYIETSLEVVEESADAGVTRAVYLSDIESVIDYSQLEFIPLEELRGDGENSLKTKIEEFLSEYDLKKKRGHGVLQLLQAPPGAGKTYALIKVAEKEALAEREIRLEEQRNQQKILDDAREQLKQTVDHEERAQLQDLIEKLQRKLNDFSVASVAWYGQYKDGYTDLIATGADPDLWYNFEARNPGNCANYDTATRLASNHHNIGKFCEHVCPLRRECNRSGYMAQDTERRQYPLTFFRFQHMQSERTTEYTRLNVIDENPGGLIDNAPVMFQSKDVYPFNPGWELDVDDRYAVELVEIFTAAVRQAMNHNTGKHNGEPDWLISGAAFLKLVDNNIRGATENKHTLQSVCELMRDSVVMEFYQPSYLGGDIDTIKKRCVPQLFSTIIRELPAYVEKPDNHYPSCIHLVGGVLELYAQHPVKFSSSVPVVVADATAMPLLYNAMFKREVEVYAPRVKNENAEVVVIHGSDWTKSQIATEIGRQITQARSGDALDEGLYDKRIVRDALAIISGLAQKHNSLLVVTHKNIKELFEKLIGDKHGNISWGHYGALRGSNAYVDYEAVVLIGAFRIPYDVMYRRISAWAWLLGLRDDLSTETIIRPMAYDGQSQGHGYRTFDNWFADAFINMVEQGELIQSAERIRPHSTNNKKYVYMVASRPALNYVTDIISKSEFMKQFLETKEKELYTYLSEFYDEYGDFPPYRTVVEKFATSNTVVSRLRQRIQAEKEK